MRKVFWINKGESVSDSDAENKAKALLTQTRIYTSNELVVHYARVLIKEGLYKANEVEFIFPSGSYFSNEDGRFENWPPELKYFDDYLDRMIGF